MFIRGTYSTFCRAVLLLSCVWITTGCRWIATYSSEPGITANKSDGRLSDGATGNRDGSGLGDGSGGRDGGTGVLDSASNGDGAIQPGTDASVTPLGATQAYWPKSGAYSGSLNASLVGCSAEPARRPLLRWHGVSGATSYQVQIDDSCSLASDIRNCSFPSPVYDAVVIEKQFRPSANLPISAVKPVGTQYFWRVRACHDGGTNCGAWSDVRYINVGRAESDFDGDGYGDLILGAKGTASKRGAAYVYYGSSTGLGNTPTTLNLSSIAASSDCGNSANSVDDLNGDGYADAMVGCPIPDSDAGSRVGFTLLFYGSASGLTTFTRIDPPTNIFQLHFGQTVRSVGDLNGDGYSEAVVISHWIQGKVYLYWGSNSQITTADAKEILNPTGSNNDWFGWSTRPAGDVNGDGLNDVIVGSEAFSGNAGRVYLWYGGAALSVTPNLTINSTVPQANSRFGSHMATEGDINGDKFEDLAISAWSFSNPEFGEGNSFFYTSNNDVISWASATQIDDPGDEFAQFGRPTTIVRQSNCIGHDDLVIGANVVKKIYVFEGPTIAGTDPLPTYELDTGIFENKTSILYFADHHDFNGDGREDLVVSLAESDWTFSQEGRVFVYHNSAQGFRSVTPLILTNPVPGTDSFFGGLHDD